MTHPGENRGRGRPCSDFFQTVVWSLRINYSEFKLHVYGKREIQVENFLKTARNNAYGRKIAWNTDLCVETINSKRQVKGKLGHVVRIRFTVWRKRYA